MQMITIQVKNSQGLRAIHVLEQKHCIQIVDDADLSSPALPGSALSLKAFKDWISEAEDQHSVSLKEAKTKWAGKRKQLQNRLK